MGGGGGTAGRGDADRGVRGAAGAKARCGVRQLAAKARADPAVRAKARGWRRCVVAAAPGRVSGGRAGIGGRCAPAKPRGEWQRTRLR